MTAPQIERDQTLKVTVTRLNALLFYWSTVSEENLLSTSQKNIVKNRLAMNI